MRTLPPLRLVWLPAVALLCGLLITVLLVWHARQADFRLWEQRAVSEAERLSSELGYRVTRAREPLVSAAVLYLGSEEVTQEEIVAAYDQLMVATERQNGLSLAFAQPDGAGGYRVSQAAGDLALLPEGPSPGIHEVLIPPLEAARRAYPNLVTGPLFRTNGTSYLTMTIEVTNAGEPGVLISLIDFSSLVDEVMQDLLVPGTRVEIYHPDEPRVDHADLPPLPTAAEVHHATTLDMDGDVWSLQWSFDADFETVEDRRLIWSVLVSGNLISLLLALVLYTLIRQHWLIQREVDEKTQELIAARDLVVQREKLAALGGLVAGFSHELNTPVGNGLMAATTLQEQTQGLKQRLDDDQLKRSELEAYLVFAQESASILQRNLDRSARLINSFKDVAIDQTSERRRTFSLRVVIDEVMATLGPSIRRVNLELETDIPDTLQLDSYPGPLEQVIANLVTNSLVHAFPEGGGGRLTVMARPVSGNYIEVQYMDNGVGMPQELARKVFEPFFTTRMGQGGNGLGLHIAYNLVHSVLGGSIEVTSQPGAGTRFVIRIPERAPDSMHAGEDEHD
ncbi:HAMP domain-containing histidine kinase [Natronospirillum operosum]|uniref:histidine kinase n=1 Tax=Natronospirillum operosum TaxID=2759953 RepID=A0A4Z0WJY3_9GAMM|nr:HAMP domain-containing histidine kinase [Natronospirillum operosum]